MWNRRNVCDNTLPHAEAKPASPEPRLRHLPTPLQRDACPAAGRPPARRPLSPRPPTARTLGAGNNDTETRL